MWTTNNILNFINSIITSLNKNFEEHKRIEKRKFWKNLKVWTPLLYESKNGGFFEWIFLWRELDRRNGLYNYNYKVFNNKTWYLELCPIYNIAWYIEK